MSCSYLAGSWIVFLLLVLAFALFSHLMFLRFARSIATAHGREAEYRSNASNDDVGTNDFVREQFEKLSNGDFDDIEDEALNSLGRRARQGIAIQVGAVLLLIACAVWLQAAGCF